MNPRVLLAAALTVAGMSVAACSGPEADPAKTKALADVLAGASTRGGIASSTSQASCLAAVYLDSDLSAKALAALERGEPLAPKTGKDTEAISNIAAEVAKRCL